MFSISLSFFYYKYTLHEFDDVYEVPYKSSHVTLHTIMVLTGFAHIKSSLNSFVGKTGFAPAKVQPLFLGEYYVHGTTKI